MRRTHFMNRPRRFPHTSVSVTHNEYRTNSSFEWKRVWIEGIASSLAVAMMAAVRGCIEGRPSCTPLNAISHILWGRGAARQTNWTLRYTGLGLLLNGVACVFWAGFFQAWRRTLPTQSPGPMSALAGIGTSAVAYITDYYVVPRRFTPGFELCLSRRSFPWLYAALAVGLLVPHVVKLSERRGDERAPTP